MAEEGINGTVAGSREGIDALGAFLREGWPFEGWKQRVLLKSNFFRIRVRLKKQIVTLGVPEQIQSKLLGVCRSQQWNELLMTLRSCDRHEK